MLHSLKKRIALWLCPELAEPKEVKQHVPVINQGDPMAIRIIYPESTNMPQALGIPSKRFDELVSLSTSFSEMAFRSTPESPFNKQTAYVEIGNECKHPNELAICIGLFETMMACHLMGVRINFEPYEL